MAVGLHRPHMDWVVPPSFLALQPPASSIKLAEHTRFSNATPGWAFYNCTELTGRPRLKGSRIEPELPLPTVLAQDIRRNYFAAVEYMDSQVGRLLEGLERLQLAASTAVVLHGDHGCGSLRGLPPFSAWVVPVSQGSSASSASGARRRSSRTTRGRRCCSGHRGCHKVAGAQSPR